MSKQNSTAASLRSGDTMADILTYIRERRRLQIGIIAGTPAAVLAFFFVGPLFTMGWLSFLTELPPDSKFTLSNYIRVFSPVYAEIVWQTLVITVQTTAVVTIAGYTLAYSAVRFSKRTTVILLLVILPYWTNYIIRMFAWVTILQRGGVLSSILNMMNLASGPQGFLFTQKAVLVGFSYVWLPLAVLPFYASIKNIDESLIEAAKDLGSGPIKTFFTVTLPMTKEGIVTGVILVAIPTFGAFITPVMLGGSNVVMIGMVIARQFNRAFNWPFGSALGAIVGLFVVLSLLAAIKAGAGGELFGSSGGEQE